MSYSDQILTLEFLAFPVLVLVVKVGDTAEYESSLYLLWHSVDPESHTYSVSHLLSATPGVNLVRKG